MAQSSRARPSAEVVVPLRTTAGRVIPVTHVRSTLIASSLQTLRGRGMGEAYLRNLPDTARAEVLEAVAGMWLPLSIAVAHYEAANALGLSVHDQLENGREVAKRVQDSMLGTLVRAAKGIGVTPWTGLEQFQRLWDRMMEGGSGAVYRIGPKEARVEAHGCPLVRIPYFRNSWRGMFAGSGSLFCERMFVSEIPGFTSDTTFGMRVAWA